MRDMLGRVIAGRARVLHARIWAQQQARLDAPAKLLQTADNGPGTDCCGAQAQVRAGIVLVQTTSPYAFHPVPLYLCGPCQLGLRSGELLVLGAQLVGHRLGQGSRAWLWM
jgi:hypothetical protein